MHTKHVQGFGVQLIKSTKTLESGSNRDLNLIGELLEDLGAIGTGKQTLTNIENGFLCDVHEAGDTANGGLERLLAQLTSSHCGSTGKRRDSALHGNRVAEDAGGNILGKVNQDGTRTTASSDLKGLLDAARQLSNRFYHDVPLGAGTGDTNNIGFLESVGSNGTGNDLTTEDDHGGTIRHGILHGGDGVGGTRAGSDEDNTGLARSTGITLGHVTSALLVLGEDEVEVFRVVNGIKDGKNGTTRVTD